MFERERLPFAWVLEGITLSVYDYILQAFPSEVGVSYVMFWERHYLCHQHVRDTVPPSIKSQILFPLSHTKWHLTCLCNPLTIWLRLNSTRQKWHLWIGWSALSSFLAGHKSPLSINKDSCHWLRQVWSAHCYLTNQQHRGPCGNKDPQTLIYLENLPIFLRGGPRMVICTSQIFTSAQNLAASTVTPRARFWKEAQPPLSTQWALYFSP